MVRQQRLGRDLDGEEEGEREGYGVLGFVYRDGGLLSYSGVSADDRHGDIRGHGGVDVRHGAPLPPPLHCIGREKPQGGLAHVL